MLSAHRRPPALLLAFTLLPLACQSPPATAPSSEPAQGNTPPPDHQWSFEETSGRAVSDAAGKVTGTLGPSAVLGGPGKIGAHAVRISPADPIDPDANVDFGTAAPRFDSHDFTIAHWYKTTFNGTAGRGLGDILGNRVATSHGKFVSARIRADGTVELAVDQDESGTNYVAAQTSRPVNDGAWHHLAYVRRGANVTVYVDGILSASATAPSGQPAIVADATSSTFRIGHRLGPCDGCNFFAVPSSFDDLRVYHTALSPDAITALSTPR